VLSFTWSTNISNIQNFAILIISRESGVVMNVFVKGNGRKYSLPVEIANYSIALTAFDHCGQHFTSEKVLIINDDGTVEKLKPDESILEGFCAHSCPTLDTTTASCAENQQNRAGGTGLRTVLPLALIAILVAGCC
jgi:hypothetical protein